jgi:hypothetical protein
MEIQLKSFVRNGAPKQLNTFSSTGGQALTHPANNTREDVLATPVLLIST